MNLTHRATPPSDVGHETFAHQDGAGQAIGAIPPLGENGFYAGKGIDALIGQDGKESFPPRSRAVVSSRSVHVARPNADSVVAPIEAESPRIHLVLRLLIIAGTDENRNPIVPGFAKFRVVSHRPVGPRIGGLKRYVRESVELVVHDALLNVRQYLGTPRIRIPQIIFTTEWILRIHTFKIGTRERKLLHVA